MIKRLFVCVFFCAKTFAIAKQNANGIVKTIITIHLISRNARTEPLWVKFAFTIAI